MRAPRCCARPAYEPRAASGRHTHPRAIRRITAPVEPIFNGIITNDKFCLSRIKHLPTMSARKGFPREIQYPSEATQQVCCPKAEIDEKTTVEYSTHHNSGSRGTTSLGSSLSTPCAGYLVHLFQKRALTMAQPFFFLTLYASVGDLKVSCRMCLLPDF
jgi:hypothetical protein